jgi:hypothetical protein
MSNVRIGGTCRLSRNALKVRATSEDRVVSVPAQETMRRRLLQQDATDPDITVANASPKLGLVRGGVENSRS